MAGKIPGRRSRTGTVKAASSRDSVNNFSSVERSKVTPPGSVSGVTKIWRVVVGKPLRYSDASKEEINPIEGLSALSLDALTSVAYGPEALIAVLALGGASALHLVLPITVVIVMLLAILVTSYRQVIDAYPGGGGAYAVSKANLGKQVSLVAAGSLIVDYTLTVAVSIAAGVGALTSAYPGLSGERVPICIAIVAIITAMNLRGLGETARVFLLPTMIFIFGLYVVIAFGLLHPLGLHNLKAPNSFVSPRTLQTVGILLILKAFSAGCSALTGVEAIANGVPLYKEPRASRAKKTELLLGIILGTMLLGLAYLANTWHITTSANQTVLSQIMAIALGRGVVYYFLSITITLVLALAANTSFGGLPVLASLLANDNFLPHRFGLRGERQVYAFGIWVLALLSSALLIGVNGNTNSLIPMFAIGVFTGFTLSQSGLVLHWRKSKPSSWQYRAFINGFGAIVTGISTIIFLTTKFTSGAWIVLLAVPIFVLTFNRIHGYYQRVGIALSLGKRPQQPVGRDTIVIVPIAQISKLTEYAFGEALSLGQEVVAVYVKNSVPTGHGDAQDHVKELEESWTEWNPGIKLELLENEYSSIVRPIVSYIDKVRTESDNQIVVLIPVLIPDRKRYRLLHNQLDVLLSAALRGRTDLVIARAKFPLVESLNRSDSPELARE